MNHEAREAGIDYEAARRDAVRITEGFTIVGSPMSSEDFQNLARAYLALLATHEGGSK